MKVDYYECKSIFGSKRGCRVVDGVPGYSTSVGSKRHVGCNVDRRFTMEEVERFAKERGLTLFRPENEALRILIVDDNDQFVSTLKDVISSIDEDIQLETAKNGFSAGSKIHSFNPDVILLDIRMPGIDGIEVCRFIKETPATRSIRVIGMTGFPGNGTVEAVVDAGAEKCLTKPFGANELMEALNLKVEAA